MMMNSDNGQEEGMLPASPPVPCLSEFASAADPEIIDLERWQKRPYEPPIPTHRVMQEIRSMTRSGTPDPHWPANRNAPAARAGERGWREVWREFSSGWPVVLLHEKRTLAELKQLPPSRKEAVLSKSKYYFPFSPCPKGHLDKRAVKSYVCMSCNEDSYKNWKQNHPEKMARAWKRCADNNPERIAFHSIRANPRRGKRVGHWTDVAATRPIYVEAKRRGLEVDHVLPLIGRRVSGLHHHRNLQLLTKGDNSAKGNRITRTELDRLAAEDMDRLRAQGRACPPAVEAAA